MIKTFLGRCAGIRETALDSILVKQNQYALRRNQRTRGREAQRQRLAGIKEWLNGDSEVEGLPGSLPFKILGSFEYSRLRCDDDTHETFGRREDVAGDGNALESGVDTGETFFSTPY